MKAIQLNLTPQEAKRIRKAAADSVKPTNGAFALEAFKDRVGEIIGIEHVDELDKSAAPVVCNVVQHVPTIPYGDVQRIVKGVTFVPGFSTLLWPTPEVDADEEGDDPTRAVLRIDVPRGFAGNEEAVITRLEEFDSTVADLREDCIAEWTTEPEPSPEAESSPDTAS